MVNASMLEQALLASYDAETCYPGDRPRWAPENPALGHCAVTALLVQDVYGGVIVNCTVTQPDASTSSHYFNRLPGGAILDFTRSQFPAGSTIPEGMEKVPEGYKSGRHYLVASGDTLQRYELLRTRVLEYLELHPARHAAGTVAIPWQEAERISRPTS